MSLQRVITVATAAMLASAVFAQDKPDLKDPKVRASYAVGTDIGGNLKRQDLDLDPKALAAGIADAFSGKLALSEAELQETIKAFRQQLMAGAEAKQKAAADRNLKAGEEYLAANLKKEGVKATASGLQYKVIKAGTGASPKSTDEVKVHYHGTLIDGTVFDSSVERNDPVTFPVTGVIPGWVEALQLMKVGDKWQIYLPTKLAYGENAPGGKIGPNSALIFDVELLAISGAK